MLLDGAKLLVAAVTDDEARGDGPVVKGPGIPVSRGDERRGTGSTRLEPSIAPAAICAAVYGAQPPAVAVVVDRGALGQEPADRGLVQGELRGSDSKPGADGGVDLKG